MGINFGSFVGGLAKSLDERLKDDMKRTAERSDRVREYHVTRASRKEERFEAEQKELEETLSNLASFMSKSGIEIPEGVTEADFAAQLYKGAGGTISGGKELVKSLRLHDEKKGDIKGLIKQANFATKGKGFGDYINNFVRRPSSMIKVPENLRGGTGFLKNVDITKGMQGEMDAMFTGDKQADKFDIKGIDLDRSQMVGAIQYRKEQTATDLAIEQAQANIKKTNYETDMADAYTSSGFMSKFEKDKKALADARGIQLDQNNNINIKNAREKKIDLGKFQADLVKSMVNTGNTATGTLNDKRNLALVLSQASVKDDKGNYLIAPKTMPSKAKDLVAGTVYNMLNKKSGIAGPYIHLGVGIPPIPLFK
jgi:hypothetical protein